MRTIRPKRDSGTGRSSARRAEQGTKSSSASTLGAESLRAFRRRLAVAVRDRGYVDLVAVFVRERPPRRRVVVTDDMAAGRQRGVDPLLCLFDRHPHCQVDRAQATWPRLFHLLDPDGGAAVMWIDQ